MKKKTFIILGIIIAIYVSFVTIDCIRLKNSGIGTKPFITINIKDYENGNEYTGLGYSIRYFYSENTFGSGVEIKLFNIIPIWYIEAQ